MKKLLFFIPITIIFISACKKDSANGGVLGTGNFTVTATMQTLTNKVWLFSISQNGPSGPQVMEFSTANSHSGPTGGTVAFGQESESGVGLGNGSTDTFNLYVSGGITYLTITDDIAAISLTGFSTYYKLTAISSSGFTLASANQVTSVAPSFPVSTLTYVVANP